MGACSIIAELARWSYFIIAVLSVMNSFIHIHIQLETNQCTKDPIITDESMPIQLEKNEYKCIGRSLAWRYDDNFDLDTNQQLWRQIFTLQPEIFFDIWPPVILSVVAVLQHFDVFKWETISGNWGRALLFIVTWQLFCVLGYGSNFGIIIGLIGLCGVAFLYLIMCIGLLLGLADTNIRDEPVLDLNAYLTMCSPFNKIKQQRDNDIASMNHENDEHHPLSPEIIKHNSDAASNPRLSVTQPGSVNMIKNKMRSPGYNEINMNTSDSNDHEDLKQNEYQGTGYNKGNTVALPKESYQPNETGCEVDSPSISYDNHDGLYEQPNQNYVTPR